jgi:hypothetical protein
LIPVLAGTVAVATGTAKALRPTTPSAHTTESAISASPTELKTSEPDQGWGSRCRSAR